MAAQSRKASLVEALSNVAIGYVLAIATQHILFPLFGFHAGLAEHGAIAAVFTLTSLCRSYLLRRVFQHVQHLQSLDRDRRAKSLAQRLAWSADPSWKRSQ